LKDLKVRPTAAVLKYETDQDLTSIAQTFIDALLEGNHTARKMIASGDRQPNSGGSVDQPNLCGQGNSMREPHWSALKDATSSQLVESLAPSLDASETQLANV